MVAENLATPSHGSRRPTPGPPPRRSTSGSTARANITKVGTVEVDNQGKITTMSAGKNRWHNDLRMECLHWLDISCTNFSCQHVADWDSVCKYMMDRWEYSGNDGKGLHPDCLAEYGRTIMKTK